MQEEVIILPVLFLVIFAIAYISITSRHRERMAMIDKGMDLGAVKDMDKGFSSLRNGLFLAGIGLGLLLGHLLASTMFTLPDGEASDNPLPYFMLVLLCGGSALIAHHFIIRRKLNEGK